MSDDPKTTNQDPPGVPSSSSFPFSLTEPGQLPHHQDPEHPGEQEREVATARSLRTGQRHTTPLTSTTRSRPSTSLQPNLYHRRPFPGRRRKRSGHQVREIWLRPSTCFARCTLPLGLSRGRPGKASWQPRSKLPASSSCEGGAARPRRKSSHHWGNLAGFRVASLCAC